MAYETDEQQVEALKAWWDENGTSIIFAVVFALAVVGGWRGWQAWQGNRAQDASQHYAELLDSIEQGDAAVSTHFNALQADFSDTPYGVLGALQTAKHRVQTDDLEGAASALQFAIDEASDADLKAVAAVRLARVLLELERASDALAALPSDAPSSFEGLIETVRGDIHLEQGDFDAARTAYQRAVDSGAAVADRRFVDMQLTDLAGKTAK